MKEKDIKGNYFTSFSLRVSEELLENVKVIAKHNLRSLNKEIEFALNQYVENNKNILKEN